ncbi:hypothetical protein FGF1_22730 [Flavobacteriaceae bacterium GF1]
MKNMICKAFLVLLAIVTTSSAQEKTNHAQKGHTCQNSEKVNRLFEEWNTEGSPGASVVVVHNGNIIHSKGYGSANLEYAVPNTPETVFHVASISKQFTAFAIALLESQDRLSLEDDIRNYLPKLPDFGHKITIDNLIHHTSGLKDHGNLLSLAGWRHDDVKTQQQILGLVQKQETLDFVPGEEFVYSNTNYDLLAQIVEKVGGQGFSEWTRENIFKPLGMDTTFFNDSHERVIQDRGYSYKKDGKGYKKEVLNYAYFGSTSLFTTVGDLARWANNFKTMELGNEQIMAKMHQQGVLNNGETTPYAFGQLIESHKGLRMVSHGGADAGYRTYMARIPDHDFSVAVLCNLGSMNPIKLAKHIIDIYLEAYLEKENSKEENKSTDMEQQVVAKIETSTLKRYEGRYELMENIIITIWLEENGLKGNITGKRDVHEFVPISQSEFHIPTLAATITFSSNKNDGNDELVFKKGARSITARRVGSFNPNTVDLEEYVGTYFNGELSVFYTLMIRDGKIIAQQKRLDDIILVLSHQDFFVGDQWFFKNVEMVRNDDDTVWGFKVSGKRARNIPFKKMD